MSIRVLPTRFKFGQELKLFAAGEGVVEEQLVAKLVIVARTNPPVNCSHQTVVFDDHDQRTIKLTTSDKRFRIRESEIQLSMSDFQCTTERSEEVVTVILRKHKSEANATEYNHSVILNIPLEINGSKEVRWFAQELVLAKHGDVVISPSTVVLRRSKDNYLVGGIMVHDRLGNPSDQASSYQCYIERDGERLSDVDVVIAELRPVAGNRMYLRLTSNDCLRQKNLKELTMVIRDDDRVLKRLPISVLD